MVSWRAILVLDIQDQFAKILLMVLINDMNDFDLLISDLLDLIIRFLGLLMLIVICHERWIDLVYDDAGEIPYKLCY